LLLVFGPAGGAAAQSVDPYSSDPLGLIAFKGDIDDYSTGQDHWEVWICRVPDGGVPVAPGAAAEILNTNVGSFFQSMSGGSYHPLFVAGGTVTASLASRWPDDPFHFQSECEGLVAAQATRSSEGAVIVVDAAYGGGYGTGGRLCQVSSPCPVTYPANFRFIVLGAGAVVAVNESPAALRTSAHEVGHALFWPHSYGGLVEFEAGVLYEYDNPMDLMSGGDSDLLNIGTIAVNRYAAGWFGGESVMFHRGGKLNYTLGASTGLQMVVLPTGEPGHFEMIGARLRSAYDGGIPAEGIEVYRVQQGDEVCAVTSAGECYGLDRRTAQVPAEAALASVAHVHGAGDRFTVRDMTITVTEQTSAGFTIQIEGPAVPERFVDDDGNLHEASIASIAALGITRGCNPPLVDRYCPASAVTRAEMAAFLVAALGEQPSPTFTGFFSDVLAGEWYTPYVERLRQLGIAAGDVDGTFGPDRALTRAEMAVFLARAFALPVADPGNVFDDVPGTDWYSPAVEAIRVAGITAGCSLTPPRYCPADPVKRDQMATFVARSLGL
jgi:hypothetical protein